MIQSTIDLSISRNWHELVKEQVKTVANTLLPTEKETTYWLEERLNIKHKQAGFFAEVAQSSASIYRHSMALIFAFLNFTIHLLWGTKIYIFVDIAKSWRIWATL